MQHSMAVRTDERQVVLERYRLTRSRDRNDVVALDVASAVLPVALAEVESAHLADRWRPLLSPHSGGTALVATMKRVEGSALDKAVVEIGVLNFARCCGLSEDC